MSEENKMTNTNENQNGAMGKKDLVALLQNHRAEALKDSQKKYEEASNDVLLATWHNCRFDKYEVPGIYIVTQLRISSYNQMLDSSNMFLSGKGIQTDVFLYDSKDKEYKQFEFGRGETPESAYDSMIERLLKGEK